MKNSRDNIIKRQQSILQCLREDGSVTIEDLSRHLHVSSLTIRRDLQSFERQGILRCAGGCARLISGSLMNDPGQMPQTERTRTSKDAIARRAASFVEDGDTIFINSSSTAIQMLSHIVNKRVVVITNNCMALLMRLDPHIELVLTGGNVHSNKQSMVGEVTIGNLSQIAVCKVFLGVSGISAKHGITTCVLQETPINEMMIRRAGSCCVVLADGSKVGQRNNFKCGSAESVTTLITDETADPGEVFLLREQGVQVILTNEENEVNV